MAKSNPKPIGFGFGSDNMPNFERRMLAKRGPQPSATRISPAFVQRFDRMDFGIDMRWRLQMKLSGQACTGTMNEAEIAE